MWIRGLQVHLVVRSVSFFTSCGDYQWINRCLSSLRAALHCILLARYPAQWVRLQILDPSGTLWTPVSAHDSRSVAQPRGTGASGGLSAGLGGTFFFFSFMQTTATDSKRIANVLVPHSVRWQILWQEPHGRDVDSGGAQAQPLMHMQHDACSDTLSCGSCWMEVNIANGRVALINWWVWEKRKVWKVPLNKLRGYLWSSSWSS